jgi:diacylglycerol kinase (ATP)
MKKAPLYKSFGYAFAGIFACIKKERNIKIHLCFTAAVIFFGFFLRISPIEWCICLTLFGLILALEIVNTAIEAVVDLVTEEHRPLAGLAKDAAAGAVLIAAICAAAAGLIIFLPKGIAFLGTLF